MHNDAIDIQSISVSHVYDFVSYVMFDWEILIVSAFIQSESDLRYLVDDGVDVPFISEVSPKQLKISN